MVYQSRKIAMKKYTQTRKGKTANLRAQKVFNLRQRGRLFNLLGGHKCAKCGFDDFRVLQLDHINGKGGIEIKIYGGTNPMISYYLKHKEEAKEKLQVLCANCNWIKRYEESEYFKSAKSN